MGLTRQRAGVGVSGSQDLRGFKGEVLGWHMVRTGIRPPKYPGCPETLLQTGSPCPPPPSTTLGPTDTGGFENRPG